MVATAGAPATTGAAGSGLTELEEEPPADELTADAEAFLAPLLAAPADPPAVDLRARLFLAAHNGQKLKT